jgi:ribulose 1,5-bisphosphate synthetase/thiazole synthase
MFYLLRLSERGTETEFHAAVASSGFDADVRQLLLEEQFVKAHQKQRTRVMRGICLRDDIHTLSEAVRTLEPVLVVVGAAAATVKVTWRLV